MELSLRYILQAVLLGLVCIHNAYGEVYRWKDASGKYNYSTTLPTGVVVNIEVKRGDQWIPYEAELSTAERKPTRVVVEFERHGSAILVKAVLNNRLTGEFVIDTGATYTVISRAVAAELGITPSSSATQVTLQTANGKVAAPLVQVSSIKVGELEVRDVVTAVQDITDAPSIAGLLGLSFLNRFRITVDASKGHLILERNPDSSQAGAPGHEEDCFAAGEMVQKGLALNDGSDREASYYQKALELCKTMAEAHYYLGVVYFKQKRYQNVIIEAQEILRINPNMPDARYMLGVVYTAQGNYLQAEIELRKALELNPGHKNAKELLNKILASK